MNIWFPRRQCEVFDAINARPDGVSWQELRGNRDSIKAAIWQINCKLEETDYRIRGRRGRYDAVYKLVKVR